MQDADFQRILLDNWQTQPDPSHDLGHVSRVVKNARLIAKTEGGDLDVLIPAAWLHDIVNVPKNHPDRAKASVMAADVAVQKLTEAAYTYRLDAIHHAIAAHSFSAAITPSTLEAKILQDADRLDALGAIGIARTFAVSGQLGRALFDSIDPLALNRAPDDRAYALDHFQVKLFKVAETLQTATARSLAAQRVAFMHQFASQINAENE